MGLTEDTCVLAMLLLEGGLAAALAALGIHLHRLRINGPCRLCLYMLIAWRASVMITTEWARPCWDYLWGVLFAFSFLYATYHLARLINRIRGVPGPDELSRHQRQGGD